MDRRVFLLGGLGLGGAALAASLEEESDSCKPCTPDSCGPDGCPDGQCVPCQPLNPYPQPAPELRGNSSPVRAYTGVVLDLPPAARTKNWGGGSCVHASTVNLLLWMGMPEMAKWWRNNYSGGEYDSRLVQRMEAAKLKFAYVHDDPNFFAWCTRTRRGAGIFYKPAHSINFVGMANNTAYMLDNNATGYPESHGQYESEDWETFVRKWRGYGGFAWTLIYDPPPGDPVYSLSHVIDLQSGLKLLS